MSFKNIEDYPEFAVLVEQRDVIIQELGHVPGWINWSSDVFDQTGKCLFLNDGEWTIHPAYFGEHCPKAAINSAERNMLESLAFRAMLLRIFPQTTAMLQTIPSISYAAFSRLSAKSTLREHQHHNPDSLIMHMGLIIPPKCGLRVGKQKHLWKSPGDMIIFDDTQIHTAWNDSALERVVLYVEFIRQKGE